MGGGFACVYGGAYGRLAGSANYFPALPMKRAKEIQKIILDMRNKRKR
jgi:hypothetical protein